MCISKQDTDSCGNRMSGTNDHNLYPSPPFYPTPGNEILYSMMCGRSEPHTARITKQRKRNR